MFEKKIVYFIKFFDEKIHAESFMDGFLHLKTLSYYKSIEDAGDGRKDTNEGVSYWWQPSNVIMKLSNTLFGEIIITNDDFAAPILISYNKHEYLHIFCMYAVWTNGFELIEGRINYSTEDADRLRNQLKIDSRCFQFGKHAVIVPAFEFKERLKIALEQTKKACKARLIDYFEDEQFSGQFCDSEIPFKKTKEFTYQNEYRICIDNKIDHHEPYTLSMGSLRDISALVESEKLNDLLRIDSIV